MREHETETGRVIWNSVDRQCWEGNCPQKIFENDKYRLFLKGGAGRSFPVSWENSDFFALEEKLEDAREDKNIRDFAYEIRGNIFIRFEGDLNVFVPNYKILPALRWYLDQLLTVAEARRVILLYYKNPVCAGQKVEIEDIPTEVDLVREHLVSVR